MDRTLGGPEQEQERLEEQYTRRVRLQVRKSDLLRYKGLSDYPIARLGLAWSCVVAGVGTCGRGGSLVGGGHYNINYNRVE